MAYNLHGNRSSISRVDRVGNIYQLGLVSLDYFVILVLLVGLVLSLVIGWLTRRRLRRRLSHLREDISRIAASSDLSARVSVTGRDELSSLANEVNQILSARERSEKTAPQTDQLEIRVQQLTEQLQQAKGTLDKVRAALVGYDILKSIKFPWPVAEIVLQHHERIVGYCHVSVH